MAQPPAALHTFDTPLGPCGVSWNPRGIDRVQLPEANEESTLLALSIRRPDHVPVTSPPAPIKSFERRVRKHLSGRRDPFLDVRIDLTGSTEYSRLIYDTLRRVEPGGVVSYGELAELAGRPGGARAVGRAMGANPVPLVIPCHRVVTADHRLGGFTAAGGARLKARLLHAEGYVLNDSHEKGAATLKRADPVLRPLIKAVGPYLAVVEGERSDPYDSLVTAIVHQQISMAAARSIGVRLRALGDNDQYPSPGKVLRMRDATLRKAGLSAQKVGYLRDLAANVQSGELPLPALARMDDEQAIESICRVRGLGRWSAQMFLMFHLGRLDVLPVDDLGFRNAAQKAYGLKSAPTRSWLEEKGEQWRPYRSMATWYLWQSLSGGILA